MKAFRTGIKNLAVVLFMVVLGIAFIAVICRYVLNSSLTWAEEAIRYICMWVFFLTMFESTRTGSHLALDLIPGFLHGKPKAALNIFIELVNIIFDGILIYYGTNLTIVNMMQKSPAMHIPYGYIYMAIPMGSALMAIFSIQRIINFAKELAGKEVQK